MQDLVDGLAHLLGRSVAVDDRDLRLIVHSTHFGDVDSARLRSLTDRGVDEDVRHYLTAEGIRSLSHHALIPARPPLGVDHPRRCFPLRHLHELFGYMWVTEDSPLSADELAQAEAVSARLASLIAREARTSTVWDEEVEPLVRRLLDSNDARSAAEELIRTGVLTDVTFFDVYAIGVGNAAAAPDRVLTPEILREAFSQVGLNRPERSWAYSTDSISPALILGYRGEPSTPQRRSIAAHLMREIDRRDPTSAHRFDTVGVGLIVSTLSDAPAAFHQARSGARIAATVNQQVGIWSEHPLEALLDAVVDERYSPDLIPRVLDSLDLAADSELAEFLRVYLDAAGNVAHVSELLGLHRTTVYYRLQRFKKSTGLDLERGDDRLLLHLWLHVLPHGPRPVDLS